MPSVVNPLLLHSMATPELDAVGCLATAAELGLQGIELIVDDAYPAAISLGSKTSERIALRHEAVARNLQILSVSSYERNLDSADASVRASAQDAIRRTLDLAVDLGAEHIRVLAGGELGHRDFTETSRLFGEALHSLGEDASDMGVSLDVEIHMDTLASTAAGTAVLVDAAASAGVSALYDQCNLAIMGAESPTDAIAELGGRVRHMHVKNFVPTPTDREPVGLVDGVVDWPDVFSRMTDYDGPITLEYERRWYPALPPAGVGLLADRDLVRSLISASVSPTKPSTQAR